MIGDHLRMLARLGLGDGKGLGGTWGPSFMAARTPGGGPRRSCPPWCMEAHIDERPGERIHNAWLRSVELTTVPLAGSPQRLWLDLVLGPGDDEPRVHLQIDDHSLVEMTISEARGAERI
ncbi:hypothetical protein OG320_06950 [Microbispora sp. NBC_01189]|uniref:hypothetical protein n=1 Tax=Microbispora sp. NBC_01189 TaxID=2903583 RepID=UPI002E0D67C6|nr:hypothetical protein OG320_06950 [Microbispora sp. NBC_01189]